MLVWLIGCWNAPHPADSIADTPACQTCHAEQVEVWKGSHHALAERLVGPDDTWAEGATRIIGVHPLEQAIVPVGDRDQVVDPARDVRTGERFSIFDDPREPGDWGHWTGGGMTWNARCASCHATGVTKGLQPDGTYRTTVEAYGVTCEACHTGTEAHARGEASAETGSMEDTCLPCHTLRMELTDGRPVGAPLLDHVLPATIADPLFRPDGFARGEAFQTGFLASRMHAAGVTCTDCHDPHSGQLRADGDALCTSCHAPHAGHVEGPACVDCHMPTVRVMGRHDRRDHAFTIPVRGQTPDPCADCHVEHPAEAEPRTPNPSRGQRAAAVARGDRGVHLEALAADDPWLRAVAAWAFEPTAGDRDLLVRLADDPVRAVRVGGQRGLFRLGRPLSTLPDLDGLYAHLADDPGMLGERGLGRIRAGDPEGIGDLERAVALDPGSPDAALLLATGWATLGRPDQQVAVLERALERHTSVDLSFGLALGLGALGRNEDAIGVLQSVVEREPQHARAWRNLAVILAAAGRREEARTAGRQAIGSGVVDPAFVRWQQAL